MSTIDPEAFDPPEVVVVSLLRNAQAAFDDLAQSSVSIHYGWYDEDESRPEITVDSPDESPVDNAGSGDDTGYSGWRGDGSGPVQDISGTVDLHLWTTSDRSTVNTRKLLRLFSQQVRIIMSENANAPTADSLNYLSYGGYRRLPPETEHDPTRWHGVVTIGYGYID